MRRTGKGRAGRRWPEMGLGIGDNLGMEKMRPWIPRCLGGKVGEMQLESTDKGRESLWGGTAPLLPAHETF